MISTLEVKTHFPGRQFLAVYLVNASTHFTVELLAQSRNSKATFLGWQLYLVAPLAPKYI